MNVVEGYCGATADMPRLSVCLHVFAKQYKCVTLSYQPLIMEDDNAAGSHYYWLDRTS
jgi:hypothetical protein